MCGSHIVRQSALVSRAGAGNKHTARQRGAPLRAQRHGGRAAACADVHVQRNAGTAPSLSTHSRMLCFALSPVLFCTVMFSSLSGRAPSVPVPARGTKLVKFLVAPHPLGASAECLGNKRRRALCISYPQPWRPASAGKARARGDMSSLSAAPVLLPRGLYMRPSQLLRAPSRLFMSVSLQGSSVSAGSCVCARAPACEVSKNHGFEPF